MGKWVHRLSLIDKEKRTAHCANCGDVRIFTHGDVWKCISYRSRFSVKKSKVRARRDIRKAMYLAQDGKCGLCTKPDEKMVLDHDHQTGMVRGLICVPCNLLLGYVDKLERDPELAIQVTQYKQRAQLGPYS